MADASDADLDYLDEYDPDRGIPFSTHLIAGSGAGLAEHWPSDGPGAGAGRGPFAQHAAEAADAVQQQPRAHP